MALTQISTGMLASGDGTVDLNIDNGTFVVDVSTSRVGIGTSSPDAPLEIDGGSTDNTVLHLTSGTANTYLKLSDSNTTNGGFIGYTTEEMSFWTNNTKHMTLTSAGNVGIGNSSPNERLVVSDAAGGTIAAFTDSTSADLLIQCGSGVATITPTTGILALGTSNTARMRIDSSGNVVVGGISLNAASSVGFTAAGQIRQVFASGVANDSLFGAISGVSNGFQILQDASNNQSYKFHNGGTPSVTIDSSGNVGIGTSTVESTLHLQASSAGGRGATLTIDNNATSTVGNESQITFLTDAGASVAGTANARIKAISTNAGNGAAALTFTTWNGSAEDERMRITSAGTVGIGTNLPSTGYKLHLAGDNTMLRMQHTGSGGNGYLDLNVDSTVATINANYASSAIDFRILTGSTERMRIASDGIIVHNGVSTYSNSVSMMNNVTYDFDIPVGNEGGAGNVIEVHAMYDHFYNFGYGASLITLVGKRGVSVNRSDIKSITTGNGGAWTVSAPNATTLRLTKSAGTYTGAGFGHIMVRFRKS